MTLTQPDSVDATFYAVIEPVFSGQRLVGARVDRITQGRPGRVTGDALVTRLTLRVDAKALLPLAPAAVVHIGASDVEVVVQAHAEAP